MGSARRGGGCVRVAVVVAACVLQCAALMGPNVCMVKQKYNITKRVKYRAPMSIRTYEWCLAMPPRCSRWTTEMRDLTRLETEERTADVAVCCPGYKIRDVSCVPVCPSGKTGPNCSMECPPNKWGVNCTNDCKECSNGATCSSVTGKCQCVNDWQGERCNVRMATTTHRALQKLPKITTFSTLTNYTTSRTHAAKETHKNTNQKEDKKLITATTAKKQMVETTTKSNVYYRVPATQTRIANITIFTKPDIETTSEKSHRPTGVVTNKVEQSTARTETAKKHSATTKSFTATTKFKAKEIWIKPAQKGDTTFETKSKQIESQQRHRNATKKEIIYESTTPKTIIVSIIPTSMSYPYKKISLLSTHDGDPISHSLIPETSTVSIPSSTSSTSTTTTPPSPSRTTDIVLTTSSNQTFRSTPTTYAPSPRLSKRNEMKITSTTNSMRTKTAAKKLDEIETTLIRPISTEKTKTTNFIIMGTTTYAPKELKRIELKTTSLIKKILTSTTLHITAPTTVAPPKKTNTTENISNITEKITNEHSNISPATTSITQTAEVLKTEDEFNILTEPEHITAVIGEKAKDRTSVDLVTVMSIAGGVMMAVITVAVIIVMIERCRKPRYENRKDDGMRMNVIMDDDLPPPPYVRSIFHTPLPDPPTSEKCHYQPISTLDRNLKQFMRPVVVQNISPIMIENFRGILECHYDHLPRRSHISDASYCDKLRCSLAPSVSSTGELLESRAHSLTESAIDALKCEAKFDEIDSTTSEPLYAEIPCWRPPSEHAVEVMNMHNGEAITEL